MIGIMASQRLPYPARAFDMAHCSRCLIPWNKYDGMYLIEVDRVLRPGGYWIQSGPLSTGRTVGKDGKEVKIYLKQEQDEIEHVARSLCWKKVAQKNDLAIWQKPMNRIHCVNNTKSVVCTSQNPDASWYVNMETCITPLPEVINSAEVAGGELQRWPKRAFTVPPRIARGLVPGITAQQFNEDNKVWRERVTHYKQIISSPLSQGRYRNVMDMNANLGGFAAALVKYPVWVMNVVPAHTDVVDTLGVIYERVFIGTYHDWCEAFSTYPRTYDLIHATNVFTEYQHRCDSSQILLEMDRILRPEGTVIFRDTVEMIVQIKGLTDGMRWNSKIIDHESGPFNPQKILVAAKTYSNQS